MFTRIYITLFSVFACLSAFSKTNKNSVFEDPQIAHQVGVDSLKLDSVAFSSDSIAFRLTVKDSDNFNTVVYDLRFSSTKAISIRYEVSVEEVEKRRLWGILPSRYSYLPTYSLVELMPYEPIYKVIPLLPEIRCDQKELPKTTRLQINYKIDTQIGQCACSDSENDCEDLDLVESFFDSNFYWHNQND